jgi:hypothetical protein
VIEKNYPSSGLLYHKNEHMTYCAKYSHHTYLVSYILLIVPKGDGRLEENDELHNKRKTVLSFF